MQWVRHDCDLVLKFTTYDDMADSWQATSIHCGEFATMRYVHLGLSPPWGPGALCQNDLHEATASRWLDELRERGAYSDPAMVTDKQYAIWLGGWLPLAADGLYEIAAERVKVVSRKARLPTF